MPTSSQLRNALAYMSITVLVLVFLNIYSARATRDLMFKAKCSSSQDKLKVVTSSFSGVDALTQETTEQIISVIGDMNVTRLLVTDAAGRTLYDSVPGQSAAGKMVLLQQVVQALEGNDVFCCVYEDHTLKSYAAAPILTHDTVVGCVYMMEYDASQGGIIASLERTIFRGSLVLIGILFLCAVVFSMTGSGRMRQILTSMRLVREGEYSHKIQMRGSDEYATLATEFNKLTDKLQQTEITERQFVSDASHELKTPLASIKLLSDSILQNEMDVDTMREFVADIGAESDRLTRMAQKPEGRLVLIAAGKAAWQMAKAAYDVLGTAITGGAVITKYDHVKGPIGALELFEAGHPVPDENSYRATSRALELVSGLSERDTVLFLLSGGGSALFESPLVPAEEMADVTKQLLACGADIVEMNTLRKRLSAVKGGRFAERCLPAKVFSIVLSDILGDPANPG